MPPDEFVSSVGGFDSSALTAHAAHCGGTVHSIGSAFSENVFRSRKSLKRLSGKSTAQTDLDTAEYADDPNSNPAGRSD
jgi:hypothetical protein